MGMVNANNMSFTKQLLAKFVLWAVVSLVLPFSIATMHGKKCATSCQTIKASVHEKKPNIPSQGGLRVTHGCFSPLPRSGVHTANQ